MERHTDKDLYRWADILTRIAEKSELRIKSLYQFEGNGQTFSEKRKNR